MPLLQVELDDKYEKNDGRIYLTGIQALVRLPMMQRKLDQKAGHNTAGYISGYRGSPLGNLDQQMTQAKRYLDAHHVIAQPGVNEDMAATALWGTQQINLFGDGAYDGVFGMWYGKGPGVDRTGDVFRHANLAGTAPLGGVLVLMGDDHTCESSTTAHQSEFGLVDAMIPILNPAGVAEILRFGLIGFALSRFSGCWVGVKCVHDTVNTAASIEAHVAPDIILPDRSVLPPDGLNIRWPDVPLAQEARLHLLKHDAVKAFVLANQLDRLVFPTPRAKLGVISTGKSYLDLMQALDDLGIDEAAAKKLGLRVLKLGLTYPIASETITDFAKGLKQIVVVEEKRGLIETQVKEILFGLRSTPSVVGKKDEDGNWLFPFERRPLLEPDRRGDRSKAFGTPQERGHKSRARCSGSPKKSRSSDREPGAQNTLFLLRLPAQHVNTGAGGLRGARRHRLPLHGAVDGPGQSRLHPDGGRRGKLDRRGAVLQAKARLPEHRGRHLLPFRPYGDPGGDRIQGQHHLQDPLQRRRGDDRRPSRGRAADRASDQPTGRGRGG